MRLALFAFACTLSAQDINVQHLDRADVEAMQSARFAYEQALENYKVMQYRVRNRFWLPLEIRDKDTCKAGTWEFLTDQTALVFIPTGKECASQSSSNLEVN